MERPTRLEERILEHVNLDSGLTVDEIRQMLRSDGYGYSARQIQGALSHLRHEKVVLFQQRESGTVEWLLIEYKPTQ